jgi:hypothetical protein
MAQARRFLGDEMSKFSPIEVGARLLQRWTQKTFVQDPDKLIHLEALGTRFTMYPNFEERAILY